MLESDCDPDADTDATMLFQPLRAAHNRKPPALPEDTHLVKSMTMDSAGRCQLQGMQFFIPMKNLLLCPDDNVPIRPD